MNRIPNVNYTTRHDLCTGCGVCQGACPTGAISFRTVKGNNRPVIDEAKCNNDKGCHRCHDACPGLGVDLMHLAKESFTDQQTKEDKFIGRYLQCFSGYSNDHDIRYHSASGGLVSQFLIFLLEKHYIDGAVVTAFDAQDKQLVRTFIAKTREEVLSAKGSKYSAVALNEAPRMIKDDAGERFVVVGLPCHIEGFRKLEAIDRKLRSKIVGHIGIYCSSSRSFWMTEYIFRERGIDQDQLEYFAYRDEGCLGSMVVRQKTPLKPTPFVANAFRITTTPFGPSSFRAVVSFVPTTMPSLPTSVSATYMWVNI